MSPHPLDPLSSDSVSARDDKRPDAAKANRAEDEDTDATTIEAITTSGGRSNAPFTDAKVESLDDATSGTTPYESTYPEGGYGYVVLLGCVLIGACTAGSVSALGVYQAEYAERFPDKSSFQINLIGGFMGFVSGRGRRYSGRFD